MGALFSLFWMLGFYAVGASIGRMSAKWGMASLLAVAALDTAYRIYLRVEQAHASGVAFDGLLYKMVGTWLVLSAFGGVFLALGRWKSSARRRRREELGIR